MLPGKVRAFRLRKRTGENFLVYPSIYKEFVTPHPYAIQFSPLTSAGLLFAAVANSNDVPGDVSVYQVDQTTGAFTEVAGSPFSSGTGPYITAFSPLVNGNLFAATANYSSNNVSIYQVDQTTGFFNEITESPLTTGTNPYNVQFSPLISGNLFAAVVNNGDDNVSVYQVNQTTGAFTEVAGSPFAVGSSPNQIAFSPIIDGNLFAAVVNFNDSTISVFQVNATTGAFTEVAGSPFTSGGAPDGIGYSPILAGNLLFAATANYSGNNASVYLVAIPPTVTEISPNSGYTSGGTEVTITGTNFTGATAVNFGSTAATSFTVDSNTQITATAPPGTGTVDITVTTPNGTSTTSPTDQFTYIPLPLVPTVTKIHPTHGTHRGGTTVRITGTNFTGATAVNFGTQPAQSFIVDSSTKITAVSPPGTGIVDITVTTAGGTSAISLADKFTYSKKFIQLTNLKTFRKINKFATQAHCINILTWDPPLGGPSIKAYKIFEDKHLHRLLAVIQKKKHYHKHLAFKDHNTKNRKNYYYVVPIDEFNNYYEPIKVKILAAK